MRNNGGTNPTFTQDEEVKDGIPQNIIGQFLSRYERQLCKLTPNLSEDAYSCLDMDEQHARRLLLRSLSLERAELLNVRRNGDIHDELFHELSRELDREELRVRRNIRTVY